MIFHGFLEISNEGRIGDFSVKKILIIMLGSIKIHGFLLDKSKLQNYSGLYLRKIYYIYYCMLNVSKTDISIKGRANLNGQIKKAPINK